MHSSRFQDDYQQSLGQSRLGNRQLMTSHIKSTAPLPEMEKKENKKYVYLHLENSLFGGNDPNLI